MKFVFMGDSHTWPLVQGAREFGGDHVIVPQPLGSQRYLCEPFFREHEGRIVTTNPDVRSYLDFLPIDEHRDAIYVLSVGFHTAHFTWVTKNFSHIDTLQAERWAISSAAFDEVFLAKQQFQMEFVRAMKRIGMRLIVVEAPRLFRESSYCTDSNVDTIRWVDQRVRNNFANFLNTEGIPVIRLKPHMIDDDGFMSPLYRNEKEGDQHHANAKLGKELMPDIISIATSGVI